MKKMIALILATVMTLALLTACGESDALYDDFANFLNVEMVEVNADYEELKAALASWDALEDDAAIGENIRDVILPIVNGSLDKLEKISPATEEVKAVKEQFVQVMETYKAAFETLLEGTETQDDATINAALEGIDEALALLDEYNAALEALAKEVGAEIEY